VDRAEAVPQRDDGRGPELRMFACAAIELVIGNAHAEMGLPAGMKVTPQELERCPEQADCGRGAQERADAMQPVPAVKHHMHV
jgi:hypothetical protein